MIWLLNLIMAAKKLFYFEIYISGVQLQEHATSNVQPPDAGLGVAPRGCWGHA
jgi:hypothetical protein